jgi:hypothetical protein
MKSCGGVGEATCSDDFETGVLLQEIMVNANRVMPVTALILFITKSFIGKGNFMLLRAFYH